MSAGKEVVMTREFQLAELEVMNLIYFYFHKKRILMNTEHIKNMRKEGKDGKDN